MESGRPYTHLWVGVLVWNYLANSVMDIAQVYIYKKLLVCNDFSPNPRL